MKWSCKQIRSRYLKFSKFFLSGKYNLDQLIILREMLLHITECARCSEWHERRRQKAL